MRESLNEDKLIDECLNGYQSAWVQLYKDYYKLIKSIVAYPKWSFNPGLYEDLVQEIFIEVVKSLKNFKRTCKLSTFIARIAQNKCVSLLRYNLSQKRVKNEILISLEEKKDEESFIQLPSENSDILNGIIHEENLDIVRKALGALKEDCNRIISLRFLEDRSYNEIADILKLPLGTVCVQIKRCLEAFKKYYEKFCDI